MNVGFLKDVSELRTPFIGRLLNASAFAGLVLGQLVATNAAFSQTIAEWNFTGESGLATSNAEIVASDVAGPVTLTRGPGAAASTASNSFRTVGFQNDGIATSNADYFQFTLTAAAGQAVSVSSISAYLAGTSSFSASPGTTNQFAYSTDGFGFTLIGSPTTQIGNGAIGPIDTSGITALQAVDAGTTLTFRFYASGQTTTGGWGFNSPTSTTAGLTVLGTTAPATSSSVYFWTADGSALGGGGTWDTSGSNWSPSEQTVVGQAWDQSKAASFGGPAGVVTVGNVSADRGLRFTTDGYALSGGTLTLAGPTVNPINVASSASATIASTLAGTTGVLKQGDGALVLGGVNTFSGDVIITAGTLEVGADAAFGATTNDISLGGTLATTATLSLASGRDLNGGGTLSVAPGTSLTVNGNANLSALILASAGSLNLNGPTSTVGVLTMNAPGTLNSVGSVAASSITASGLTGGTATINADVAFSSTGTKTVNVPAGTLVLNGDLAGFATSSSVYLTKTGGGVLALKGSLITAGTLTATGGLQIGFSGSSPTDGGTVIISESGSAGDGQSQLRLNAGTLLTDAIGGLTVASGLNVAGRANGLAVIGGSEPITFSGQSSFFRNSGTSGELRLDVNNETTLSGGFAATSGSGTATGITIGGTGRLTLAGTGTALVDPITLQDTLDLFVDGSIGSAVTVGATNVIGGNGTIGGSLSLLSGAGFVFDPADTLTVNGASVNFVDFGVTNLVGFSSSVADGRYVLIDGLATVDTANLRNLGAANAFDLGSGRSAYFETGSLVLQVVPEPGSIVLAGLGIAAAGLVLRRRFRKTA